MVNRQFVGRHKGICPYMGRSNNFILQHIPLPNDIPLFINTHLNKYPAHMWAYARKDNAMTQYEITHMENLMVRDSYWDDGSYWDEDEEDP